MEIVEKAESKVKSGAAKYHANMIVSKIPCLKKVKLNKENFAELTKRTELKKWH